MHIKIALWKISHNPRSNSHNFYKLLYIIIINYPLLLPFFWLRDDSAFIATVQKKHILNNCSTRRQKQFQLFFFFLIPFSKFVPAHFSFPWAGKATDLGHLHCGLDTLGQCHVSSTALKITFSESVKNPMELMDLFCEFLDLPIHMSISCLLKQEAQNSGTVKTFCYVIDVHRHQRTRCFFRWPEVFDYF